MRLWMGIRKCPPRNTTVQLSTSYTDFQPSSSPPHEEERMLSPVHHTVAEKCDCRRIPRLSPLSRRFRRQSHFSATMWKGFKWRTLCSSDAHADHVILFILILFQPIQVSNAVRSAISTAAGLLVSPFFHRIHLPLLYFFASRFSIQLQNVRRKNRRTPCALTNAFWCVLNLEVNGSTWQHKFCTNVLCQNGVTLLAK